MANIDFFIHNSTKKILSLVKSLPAGSGADRGRLQEALHTLKDEHKKQKERRFRKHPPNIKIANDDDEDDELIISDTEDEFVVLKNPTAATSPSSGSSFNDDVGDDDEDNEFCDVTIRREFDERRYLEQLGHGDRYNSENNKSLKKKKQQQLKKIKGSKQQQQGAMGGGGGNGVDVVRRSRSPSLEGRAIGDHVRDVNPKQQAKNSARNKNVRKIVKSDDYDDDDDDDGDSKKFDDDTDYGHSNNKSSTRICLDQKLRLLVEKGTTTLKEIRLILDTGIQEPDGSEDLMRRKKRTVEFASRFSRNYLYQLNRTILDIEGMMKSSNGRRSNYSSCGGGVGGGGIMLNHKIFSAFHTISLGLEAYNKHLPSAIITAELPDKFREFLVATAKVCEMFRALSCASGDDRHNTTESCDNNNKESVVDIFEIYCNSLLMEEELFYPGGSGPSLSVLSVNRNHQQRASSNCVPLGARTTSSSRKMEKKCSRYSMYHATIRKDSGWKKAVANLARKKFNVASKYKTATYKHRPPPPLTTSTHHQQQHQQLQQGQQGQQGQQVCSVSKLKFGSNFNNKDNRDVRNNKENNNKVHSSALIDMDKNVTTVVQEQESRHRFVDDVLDQDSSMIRQQKMKKNDKESNLWKYANGFYQRISKGSQEMGQNEYECILQHFLAAVGTNNNNNNNNKGVNGVEAIAGRVNNTGNGRIVNEDDKEDSRVAVNDAQMILEDKFGKSIEEMDFKEFYEKLVSCANCQMPDERRNENEMDDAAKLARNVAGIVSMRGAPNVKLICIKDDTADLIPANHHHQQHLHNHQHQKQQQHEQSEHQVEKSPVNKNDEEGNKTNKHKEGPKGGFKGCCSVSSVPPEAEDCSELLIYKEREEDHRPTQTGAKGGEASVVEMCGKLKRIKKEQNINGATANSGKENGNGNENGNVNKNNNGPLKLLPKNTMLKIIDYKLQYHREAKKNYMYKKSANVVPWLLVERISDVLLEETLHAVTRDIQVDQILKKIYTQEFK